MKVTYWYSECPNDSNVYSIRTRTQKEARALVAEQNAVESMDWEKVVWPEPKKVTVEYKDGFDLMFNLSCEGGRYEESTAFSVSELIWEKD